MNSNGFLSVNDYYFIDHLMMLYALILNYISDYKLTYVVKTCIDLYSQTIN